MSTFEVTLGKGGSGTFKITVNTQTPDDARFIAESQYPGYTAQAVRNVHRGLTTVDVFVYFPSKSST